MTNCVRYSDEYHLHLIIILVKIMFLLKNKTKHNKLFRPTNIQLGAFF